MDLKHGVEASKKFYAQTFREHYNYGFRTLRFYLLGRVVKDVRGFETPSIQKLNFLLYYNVYSMNDHRQDSKKIATCVEETVNILGCTVDGVNACLKKLCSEGEKEAEICKLVRLLQNGAHLRRDWEKMCLFRIPIVLKYIIALEKVLSFLKSQFSFFSMDMLGAFSGLLQEAFVENVFVEEDRDVEPTFARGGYVRKVFLLVLEDYSKDGCFIREPELLPHTVKRVLVMN